MPASASTLVLDLPDWVPETLRDRLGPDSSCLNIGAGCAARSGFINLDIAALPHVDLCASAEDLPFADNSFDVVLCEDLLEHVDLPRTMREIHRCLRRGGLLIASVPHFTSRNAHVDPTHRRSFSFETLDFFAAKPDHGRGYYFDFCFSERLMSSITFRGGRSSPFDRVIQLLTNRSEKTKRGYELTAMSRIFPALNVTVCLVK